MTVFKTGTTQLSFTQQLLVGDPSKFVVGGQLYMYEAATTTPVQPYADANAQFVMSNPIVLGADGRIPLIYFVMADDSAVPGTFAIIRQYVRMRLLDKNGVTQFDYGAVPLLTSEIATGAGPGPGPTPTPVDELGTLKTGMMMHRYGVGKIPGFVRANGGTIGKASTAASELNDDTLANPLFLYLWGADINLPVSGSRGANAADDFAAGKMLTLPDFSGCVPGGLDNMSGSPRNILTVASFPAPGLPPTTLGAVSGVEQRAIGMQFLPPHNHPAYWVDNDAPNGHSHSFTYNAGTGSSGFGVLSITATGGTTTVNTSSKVIGGKVRSTSGGAIDDQTGNAVSGGVAAQGASFQIIQPTKLITFYLRL